MLYRKMRIVVSEFTKSMHSCFTFAFYRDDLKDASRCTHSVATCMAFVFGNRVEL